jgi:DNA replication and repair protein RecF
MQLASLSITNYKNIKELELVPSPKLTCLAGNNGMGKTNLLDAIYLLSMCKSSAGVTYRQCIRHGEPFLMLKADYIKGGNSETIVCSIDKQGAKTLKRNGKAYTKISEHIGLLPLVMISPYDSVLISDASEERRHFLNGVLVQTDNRALGAINRYNALLAQRNKLLKTYTPAHSVVLEAIDMQMIQCGQAVCDLRTQLAELLQEPFAHYYSAIAQNDESVSLRYVSDLQEDTFDRLLAQSRNKDMALQFTTVGVHRDDLELKIGAYPVRRLGSQGQQKTVLLALKLAQADVLKRVLGVAPILLLDDIFDKLDAGRIKNLMNLLAADKFGQIFLTDSNKERIAALLQTLTYDTKMLEIKDGALL